MAKLTDIKKLVVEDFPAESQDLVNTLAFSLNPLFDQLVDAFDGNIDMSNLDQQIVTITDVVVDINGVPNKNIQFNYNLKKTPQGSLVIYAVNNTNKKNYPTATPFVSFDILQQGLAKVSNVQGITPEEKHTIRLLLLTN